jgi:hypothetical protein
VNRHAKASPAGPSMHPKGRRKPLLASVAVFALALALSVGVASAVAPTASIQDAEGVAFTTASVKGHVNPEGQMTAWRFEYATDAAFTDPQQGPAGETETETDVSGPLAGLKPGTTYHLRLIASNADGEAEALASTFATDPVSAPEVSGLGASETHFSAMVDPKAPKANAELSSAEKDAYRTHWWFTCNPGCNFSGDSEGNTEANDAAEEVTAEPIGLEPNKTYDVTLHAANAGGEASETDLGAFAVAAVGPEIAPSTLWEPTSTSIQLNALVNAHNSPLLDCHFEWGIGTPSGNEAPCRGIDERQELAVSAEAGQFKLSFEGQSTKDLAFDAPSEIVQDALRALPGLAGNISVSGGPGDKDGSSPYVLSFGGSLANKNVEQIAAEDGTVPLSGAGPAGASATTATQGASGTEAFNASLNDSPKRVGAAIAGLSPGSEYVFRLVAANSVGTAEGEPQARIVAPTRRSAPPSTRPRCPTAAPTSRS